MADSLYVLVLMSNCYGNIVIIPLPSGFFHGFMLKSMERRQQGCCSQVRNAPNCAFREKMCSLKSKNPFAKQILHGFLPVTGTE